MIMRPAGLLMAAFLAASHVVAQPAGDTGAAPGSRLAPPGREELASLELHLEHAVAEVSVPHAGILLGRTNASRGYRLPGYGIVFVLTPRALPGGERAVFVLRGRGADTPSHVDVHARGEAIVDVTEIEVEAFEHQVLILQHAAEAQRRAAEEDHERIVRDVRIRLSGPTARRVGDISGEGSRPVLVDKSAPGPTSPPWSFWFGSDTLQEERSADRVVQDVRSALIEALESRGAGVAGLEADEFVTVAVDFVPGGLFASHRRPTRTLIVRARQGDLSARADGKITAEELRAQVEVIEY
jgi:hypothetical protein